MMKFKTSFSQISERKRCLKLWRRSKLVNNTISLNFNPYYFQENGFLFLTIGSLLCVELMVLGFISLILTFSQYYIAKICIPVDVADTMLPCSKPVKDKKEEKVAHRLLLWYEHGRSLAGASESSCKEVVNQSSLLSNVYGLVVTIV